MINQLNAQQQFLNSQQSARHQAAAAGLLGGSLGSFSALAGLGPSVYDIQDYMGARNSRPSPKLTCKIGKVTPKSGYILDYLHPDKVRAKVRTDYTLWQQLIIWWSFNW